MATIRLFLLEEHMDQLHALAEFLMKYEKIDGDLFAEVMSGVISLARPPSARQELASAREKAEQTACRRRRPQKAAEEKKAQQGFSVDPLDFQYHEEPRPRRWRNPRRTRISRILPAPQTCNFVVFSTPRQNPRFCRGFPFRASAVSRTPAGPAAFGRRWAGARPARLGRPPWRLSFSANLRLSPAGYRTGQKPSLPAGPRPCGRLAPHPAQKEKMFAPLDRCPKCWYNLLVNYEIWGNCHGSKSKKGIRQ